METQIAIIQSSLMGESQKRIEKIFQVNWIQLLLNVGFDSAPGNV